MLASLRSFVNKGEAFRSVDHQRTKLQSLLQEVQTQMHACKSMLVDLVRRTAKPERNQHQREQLRNLTKIKNLEQFCSKAVSMVKDNFQDVLKKGLTLETQLCSVEERSKSNSSWLLPPNKAQLNLNSLGSQNAPATGDSLLFVLISPQQYQAIGFPNFSLDKRAVVDM